MSDHSPDFTARYRVKYFDGQATHVQTWRYPGVGDGPELVAVATAVNNYYAAIGTQLWDDFQVLAASYALKDSPIFLPTSTPGIGGAVDPSTLRKPRHKANAINFVGRTSLGTRVIVYQYGFSIAVGDDTLVDDFRLTSTENAVILTTLTALTSAGADLVGNDGAAVTWYPYANVKYNDYWKRKVQNG